MAKVFPYESCEMGEDDYLRVILEFYDHNYT